MLSLVGGGLFPCPPNSYRIISLTCKALLLTIQRKTDPTEEAEPDRRDDRRDISGLGALPMESDTSSVGKMVKRSEGCEYSIKTRDEGREIAQGCGFGGLASGVWR